MKTQLLADAVGWRIDNQETNPMPRKKAPVPLPKNVTEDAMQKRSLRSRHVATHKNGHATKPRVVAGTAAARALGIK